MGIMVWDVILLTEFACEAANSFKEIYGQSDYIKHTCRRNQNFICGIDTRKGAAYYHWNSFRIGKEVGRLVSEGSISGFFQLSSAQTYLDWIVPALLKREKNRECLSGVFIGWRRKRSFFYWRKR